MSEEKPKEETKDVVSDNVALLKSKIISLEKLVEDLTGKLDEMTDKYTQAKEFVDNDAKADLIAYLAPRMDIPRELLMLKEKDELVKMKEILDKSISPAFKSGTPVSYEKKPNARQKLDNMFAENMAKLRGGKFA